MNAPRTVAAALLVEQRKPLVVDEVELPTELAIGQVLVKLHYSGICGSQIGEIDGAKGPDRFLPHLLGHEGSGTVLEIGPGVRHVAPGDRVVLHWRKGPGIEAVPPTYRWNGRTANAGWVTTFNECAVCSENRLTRIDPDLPLDVAALFGCAVTTGFGVVVNNARLSIGESVVVYGAGGVGLSIVQAAALVSANPIIAVDRFANRLDLARDMGATHTVDTSVEDAAVRIAESLGRAPLDVFIDNTGSPDVIALGYRLTGPEGRVVLVGVPKAGNDVTLHTLPLHFGKVLTGSHGGEARPGVDIPRFARLYTNGNLKLRCLIDKVYPLAGINDAISDMRNGRLAGRCLIEFP